MKKIYAIRVAESYVSKYVNFEAALTDSLTEAELYDKKSKAEEINEKIKLIFSDANVVEINFRENSDPKKFPKCGIFVIKLSNDKYWTWNYFNKDSVCDSINKDSLFESSKECQKRIKNDKLDGKVVELCL